MIRRFFSTVDTEDAQMLLLRYKNLMERLRRFEKEIFEKWTEKVPDQIETNLKKSLLAQVEGQKFITLNFDPELSAILREVHYLRLMHKENVPTSGVAFSEEQEVYRTYILHLEKTVEWYNNVRKNSSVKLKLKNNFSQICRNCSDVELKLIQAEIDLMDSLVERGCSELNWNSESKILFKLLFKKL